MHLMSNFKNTETYQHLSEANKRLKHKLYVIIFESNTRAGKLFDVLLMVFIILSIVIVMLESVKTFDERMYPYLKITEYIYTAYFTLEYLLRLYCSPHPKKYAFSFFGIIDLLATLPLYLTWLFGAAKYLLIVRSFRLIRVFRIFKLFSFLDEGKFLLHSLKVSAPKIIVFFLFLIILVISIGTIMYMVEGDQPESGFTDIPTSIYWAIVTMTTVGYGDITPHTAIGRFLSAIVMLIGYTIIAVPTGIVSAAIIHEHKKKIGKLCENCGSTENPVSANFCQKCGHKLDEAT